MPEVINNNGRKREEGRGKREEGRGKKEEGRREKKEGKNRTATLLGVAII
ncbi:hypothetical protein [Microcoleus vaginatus]